MPCSDKHECSFPLTVTTTSQARMALKMLRENKDRFDLVISDVHMPDMDGFKLLELVGLEMDLPVISMFLSFIFFSTFFCKHPKVEPYYSYFEEFL